MLLQKTIFLEGENYYEKPFLEQQKHILENILENIFHKSVFVLQIRKMSFEMFKKNEKKIIQENRFPSSSLKNDFLKPIPNLKSILYVSPPFTTNHHT